MTATMNSKEDRGLRALDPDLPFLAAEVAIDVDNLLAGRSEDRSAMRRLAGILSHSIEHDPSTAQPRSRMDFAAVSLLTEAVTQSIVAGQVKRIEDLLEEADKIAKILASGDPQTNKAELEQAGNFCVALSKAASAYRASIRDLRPSHPFRR